MMRKMQFFTVVLCVFYTVLVAKCEEGHHIDQRILEDQDNTPDFNESSVSSDNATSELRAFDLPPPSTLENIRANCSIPENISNVSGVIRPECMLRGDSAEQGPGNINSSTMQPPKVANDAGQGIDTEVADLMNRTEVQEEYPAHEHQHPLEPELPMHFPDKIQKQAEYIEDGEITEDVLRSHRDENVSDSSHGPLAVVLVSMLVALAVICYVALLLWRKYLENRYGSRTLLVNAEEFAEPSDMKHFSI